MTRPSLNIDLLGDLELAVKEYKSNNVANNNKYDDSRQAKAKRVNRESFIMHVDDLKKNMEYIKFHNTINDEMANEDHMKTPKEIQEINDTNILWTNIENEVNLRDDLDEYEQMELKENLEDQKRQALIRDMLFDNDEERNLSPDKFKLLPESNKPLDSIVSNTNARKNFMLICRESDKFIESEEFDKSPEFHYFKRCMQENCLPLPTINKISDGVLMLAGYKLNEGV